MSPILGHLPQKSPETQEVSRALAYYQAHFTKDKCMGILDAVLRGEELLEA